MNGPIVVQFVTLFSRVQEFIRDFGDGLHLKPATLACDDAGGITWREFLARTVRA